MYKRSFNFNSDLVLSPVQGLHNRSKPSNKNALRSVIRFPGPTFPNVSSANFQQNVEYESTFSICMFRIL